MRLPRFNDFARCVSIAIVCILSLGAIAEGTDGEPPDLTPDDMPDGSGPALANGQEIAEASWRWVGSPTPGVPKLTYHFDFHVPLIYYVRFSPLYPGADAWSLGANWANDNWLGGGAETLFVLTVFDLLDARKLRMGVEAYLDNVMTSGPTEAFFGLPVSLPAELLWLPFKLVPLDVSIGGGAEYSISINHGGKVRLDQHAIVRDLYIDNAASGLRLEGGHDMIVRREIQNLGKIIVESGSLLRIEGAGGDMRANMGDIELDGGVLDAMGGLINEESISGHGAITGFIINTVTPDHSANGVIHVSEGDVLTLSALRLVGGRLSGGGLFDIAGTDVFLGDLTIDSETTLPVRGRRRLSLAGAITNEGLIDALEDTGEDHARLYAAGDLTLSGSGIVVLRSVDGGRGSVFEGLAGVTLTNDVDHKIRSTEYGGAIEVIDIINNGLIEAAGGPLELVNGATTNNGMMRSTGGRLTLGSVSFINNGEIRAESGGTVRLNGQITNNTSIEAAEGGKVEIHDGTRITGGILMGSGFFEVSGQGGLLADLTIDSGVILPIRGRRQLNLSGTITNNGLIDALEDTGHDHAWIYAADDLTLSGTGAVALSKVDGGRASVFHGAPGVTVTNGADHAIRGTDYEGRIEVIDLVNNGLIEAAGGPLELANGATTNNGMMRSTDERLTLGSSSFINNGEIRAESGGIVRLNGPITNNMSIEAAEGGKVEIHDGASISGGVLTGPGLFEVSGQGGLLADLTIDSRTVLPIPGRRQLNLSGTITNNGLIDALEDTGNDHAWIYAADDLTLSGTGAVALRKVDGGRASVFHGAPGVTVTNGADHAIRGTDYEGRIEVIDLVNNGLIEAAGGPLELANGATTNNGVMRSTDQMLVLGSASIINNATILAESGGEVRVSGAMTNNGSIETKTGGAVMLNNAGNISGDGLLVYSGGVFEITGTLAIPNLMLNGVSVDAGVLPWNDQARLLGNGQIVGDFANTGEVAPGTSTGLIEIDGDYSQSGALEIELLGAGPGRFDQLDVTGQASLGGSLQVTIAEGGGFFAGDTFDFLTSETRSGEFDTVDLPTLPGGEAIFSLDYHPGGASLTALVNVVPCDSNSDGLVDSLDLLNLNTQFGGPPGTQSADFNADGRVDIEDFAVLRTFYGVASGASPPAKVTMTTPEPSTLVLLSAALWVPLKRKRKPRQV